MPGCYTIIPYLFRQVSVFNAIAMVKIWSVYFSPNGFHSLLLVTENGKKHPKQPLIADNVLLRLFHPFFGGSIEFAALGELMCMCVYLPKSDKCWKPLEVTYELACRIRTIRTIYFNLVYHLFSLKMPQVWHAFRMTPFTFCVTTSKWNAMNTLTNFFQSIRSTLFSTSQKRSFRRVSKKCHPKSNGRESVKV